MHREGCLDEFGIHVSLGAPHPAGIGAVSVDNIRNSSIKLGALCVSKKLPVAVPGGPLEWCGQTRRRAPSRSGAAQKRDKLTETCLTSSRNRSPEFKPS